MNEKELLNNSIMDQNKLDEYCLKICERLNFKQIVRIIGDLENKSCSNCNNDNCQASHGFDNEAQNYSCPMWFNPILVGRSKLLKK